MVPKILLKTGVDVFAVITMAARNNTNAPINIQPLREVKLDRLDENLRLDFLAGGDNFLERHAGAIPDVELQTVRHQAERRKLLAAERHESGREPGGEPARDLLAAPLHDGVEIMDFPAESRVADRAADQVASRGARDLGELGHGGKREQGK